MTVCRHILGYFRLWSFYFKLNTVFDQRTDWFVRIKINTTLHNSPFCKGILNDSHMQFWKYDDEWCANMFFICIVCSWCYFYSLRWLQVLLAWDRDMYKSMPFPIVQVTLIDKSSMASKKFFRSCLKTQSDGMVVCCVLGWSSSFYMHVGLTLPSCSLVIGQKWPYIPQVHYFMCIKLVATLYMWEESCAACPCLVTISLSCNIYLITKLGRAIEIYVHILSFLFRSHLPFCCISRNLHSCQCFQKRGKTLICWETIWDDRWHFAAFGG